MAYVPVPKDLSKVKTKVAFNLTKRQILCFSVALLMGLPLFFLLKDSAGTSLAAMAMIVVMLPCFLVAMYEKHGQPLEVVARVKAQLRRYKRYNMGTVKAEEILEHKGLILNKKTHECFLNERLLSLTPTEFSILAILCEQKGNVVSVEELFHQIWKDEYYSKSNNTITVHIRHLREKMEDSFENPKYIKTVWGCGYKIEK